MCTFRDRNISLALSICRFIVVTLFLSVPYFFVIISPRCGITVEVNGRSRELPGLEHRMWPPRSPDLWNRDFPTRLGRWPVARHMIHPSRLNERDSLYHLAGRPLGSRVGILLVAGAMATLRRAIAPSSPADFRSAVGPRSPSFLPAAKNSLPGRPMAVMRRDLGSNVWHHNLPSP